MKVSDLLKKVGFLNGTEIRIEFKSDKQDKAGDIVTVNEYTPEETADQIIARAAEYTLLEIDFINSVAFITGIRIAKRTPKPKKETPGQQDARREEQKKEITDELERLDQAVAELINVIVAPFRRSWSGKETEGQRGGAVMILHSVRAAVRRILTRIFRKGRDV